MNEKENPNKTWYHRSSDGQLYYWNGVDFVPVDDDHHVEAGWAE